MRQYPTPIPVSPGLHRPGLPPALPEPARLHLIAGRWIASCPRCGCEFAEGWHQGKVEAKATRRRCPVCIEVA
jgi:hypothetical protein